MSNSGRAMCVGEGSMCGLGQGAAQAGGGEHMTPWFGLRIKYKNVCVFSFMTCQASWPRFQKTFTCLRHDFAHLYNILWRHILSFVFAKVRFLLPLLSVILCHKM